MLDTSAIVAVERRSVEWDAVIGAEDDVAVAAITAAELLVGVELADDARRQRRQLFVDEFLARVPIEDYTLATAKSHAVLLAHVRRSGTMRGAHDLVIAATALATERTIVTADSTAFAGLPGIAVRCLK